MFKKETIEALAKVVGISTEDFTTKLASKEEHEIEGLSDVRTFTPDALTQFKTNLVDQSRNGIIEVAVKKYKQDSGLEFDGKTIESLSGYIKTKAEKDAGVEPEQKYKSLETKYRNLKKDKDTIEQTYTDKISDLNASIFTSDVRHKAIGGIKSETLIEKDDLYLIFTSKVAAPVQVDGIIAARDTKSGEILKDENLNPIPFIDKFKVFVDSGYVKREEGGGGKGKKGGQKNKDGVVIFTSLDEWSEHYGEDQGSDEALASLTESQKKPDFVVE